MQDYEYLFRYLTSLVQTVDFWIGDFYILKK